MNRPILATQKLLKLKKVLKGNKAALIVMQNNPDPDAMAAAAGLKELASRLADVNCSLTYGGTIGRAENRALAHYLRYNFRPFSEVDPRQFDLIAMVDTQPGVGNNPLPSDVQPKIVIDHHPIQKATRKAPFTDIRSRYGATSTIIWEYLSSARIVPEMPLATALLYGIRSDTQDLGRDCTKADIKAIETLYPMANKRMLSQIQRGQVPGEYYTMLATALSTTLIFSYCTICDMGNVENPDMIAEVADLLLRHEKINWTMCYGTYENKVLISIRTEDNDRQANEIVNSVTSGIGTGGGHTSMAGGQVPLRTGHEPGAEGIRISRIIRRRFLRTLGIRSKPGIPLIGSQNNERSKVSD